MKNIPMVKDSIVVFTKKLLNNPLLYLSELQQQYGDIFSKYFLRQDFNFPCHPRYLEHILLTHQDNYIKHPFFKMIEPFFGENNLLTTTNMPRWEHDRDLAKSSFDVTTHYEQYAKAITNQCQMTFDSWESKIRDQDVVFHIGHEMDKLYFSIFNKTIFYDANIDVEGLATHIQKIWAIALAKQTILPLLWPFHFRLKRKYENERLYMQKEAEKILNTRLKTNRDFDDLLGTLLSAYPLNPSDKEQCAAIQNYIKGFIFGGSSPMTSLLRWMLIVLTQYPDAEANITEEVARVCNGNTPTYSDYTKLNYTKAYVSEVLRLYPPFTFFGRKTVAEDNMDGFPIKAGTTILIPPFIIHRHPDFWEQPNDFKPERFLNNPLGQQSQVAYVPFSIGKRSCIGRNFALMGASLVLAMLISRFKLSLPENHKIDIHYLSLFFIRPNVETLLVRKKK